MQTSSLQADSSRYSAEDVQKILAIALGDSVDTVSGYQLSEMADELMIEPSVLARSIDAWQRTKYRQAEKRDRRKAFYRQQLIPFLALNTFLILLDISLSGTLTWAIYPLLGTGASLFMKPCRRSAQEREFNKIHSSCAGRLWLTPAATLCERLRSASDKC